jgi:sporulation protein YlmC with PRC-barrel domain
MNKFDLDNKTGKNHEGAHPNSPVRLLTATSIIGDKVFNPKEEKLGTIKDIMIDLQSGQISYIILEMGGFLGVGEKFFALPYALLRVDPKNEAFVLNQDKATLENAPGFDKDHWPDTNTHMFDSSGTYWGGFMGANSGAVPY